MGRDIVQTGRERFGRCGALHPLFRLVGVHCIAALLESEEPTASRNSGLPEFRIIFSQVGQARLARRSPETEFESRPVCIVVAADFKHRLRRGGERREVAGHESLGALPRLVGVAAEGVQLVEHRPAGVDIDGLRLRPLDQRALLVNAADQ